VRKAADKAMSEVIAAKMSEFSKQSSGAADYEA
jgi:hypothetical protein